MHYFFISNAVSVPLLKFLDPSFIGKAFKQVEMESNLTDDFMTQQQLNELYEYSQFDVSERYSSTIRVLLMTALFAPLIPICVPINLLGLILKYWIDKWLLLRRNSAPPITGKKIPKEMLFYFTLIPICLGIGSILVNYANNEKDFLVLNLSGAFFATLTMGISLIPIFIP